MQFGMQISWTLSKISMIRCKVLKEILEYWIEIWIFEYWIIFVFSWKQNNFPNSKMFTSKTYIFVQTIE